MPGPPKVPKVPRGNYQRSDFDDPRVQRWRCVVCGVRAESALHRRESRLRPKLYSLNQQTCGPACARARKTELQRERRAEKRREGA